MHSSAPSRDDAGPYYNRPVKRVPTRRPLLALAASAIAAAIAFAVLRGDGGYVAAAAVFGLGLIVSLEVGHYLQQKKRRRLHGADGTDDSGDAPKAARPAAGVSGPEAGDVPQ